MHKVNYSEKIDYISKEQAQQITDMQTKSLRKRAKEGTVRAKKVPSPQCGGFEYVYHIDDIQRLTWPNASTVARIAGVAADVFLYHIKKSPRVGVVKVGGLWKISPQSVDMLVRWARRGFP